MSTLVGTGIFAVFIVGIWFSYRLFMRGDTYEEKVASLLPPNFKPDLFHRKGDTYVGYEKAGNRLVLVDWPHAGAVFSPYRIWFQFRRDKRDARLGQLATICGK
jgi:hypothetical protein